MSASTATLEYASHAPEPIPSPRAPLKPLAAPEPPDYLRLILTAKVYDILKETPLVYASNLSTRLGNEIWLKREDLQEVFSFKIRGAFNFMAHLKQEERWKGVVTCSAGQLCVCHRNLSILAHRASEFLINVQVITPRELHSQAVDSGFRARLLCRRLRPA